MHILTPSRWAAKAYRRFGFGEERIHVVPYGIVAERFTWDQVTNQLVHELFA